MLSASALIGNVMNAPSFQLDPPIPGEVVDAATRIHRNLGLAEPIDPAAIQRDGETAGTERSVATLLTTLLRQVTL